MDSRLTIERAAEALGDVASPFVELFEHGSLVVEFYAPDGVDRQTPHTRDELYVVASGTGWFVNGPSRERFEPGEVLFVPAGVEHRFEDFTEDFATWVFFYGPEGGEQPGAAAEASADEPGLSTLCVWGGEEASYADGVTVPPVVQGVTYAFDDLEEWKAVGRGERPGYVYSRNTNPTVDVFERKMAVLEGADAATSFSTGMAAVSGALFALLKPGSRVVSVTHTYGGTNRIFTEFLPRYGVDVDLVDTSDHDAIEASIARGCDLVYLESPANPTLRILDITRLAEAAHEAGALVIADNTFATPVNQRPLRLGADLVLHSATKFIGGHSDVMGGVICGHPDLVRRIFQYREINGASLGPQSASLLIRGIKTLDLRVGRQNATALQIARHLARHQAVDEVFYPGLETHPLHDVAAKQMSGFGGVLSFTLRAGDEALGPFLGSLRYAHRAASLGSVGTLVGPPAVTSHVELTAEQRAALGIPESLIRYSVGIEDVEDLIADLDRALSAAGSEA